ncbi:hypothetical protein N0V90_005696 [Kalmusia sp. IMI 367209]|nr:hypothetical protein N0V90_005696 [Kalmusia sp. IMI 367209]
MHFSSTQLFWECYECIASETYPRGLPGWAYPVWSEDNTTLKKQINSITQQHETSPYASPDLMVSRQGLDDETYLSWYSFRIKYSRCGLTKKSDKLVAIHGIAQQVSQVTGDELVGGLWRSRIIEELCWYKSPVGEATKWRAPTWSWASSDSTIRPSLTTQFHGKHSNRCCDAELIELNVPTKLSGELEEASSFKIKCQPLRATFTPATALEGQDKRLLGLLKLVDHRDKPLKIWSPSMVIEPEIRFNMDESIREPQHGYVVVIQHCIHEEKAERLHDENSKDSQDSEDSDDGNGWAGVTFDGFALSGSDCLEALFLRMHDTNGETFQRMGLLHANRSRAVSKILNAHRMAEKKVITLV